VILASGEIDVDVCYAESARAVVRTYRLPASASVADALRLAVADPAFAAIEIDRSAVGVFGIVAGPNQPLQHGDRVEIYRALAADPKSARRARAREARKPRR
jgi:putative ubiquitin-RnfH superfamily antitoxin RatB of RatAB toxin-antitoxin module